MNFQVTQHYIVFSCIHTLTHTDTHRPCRKSSKHLSGQLVFQTNRIYLMPGAWHWGNIGGLTGGGRNWFLGFKSINLAKHKPEEMASVLCAFTVVCCCCWELTRRHVFIWHQSALCVRWQRRIRDGVTHSYSSVRQEENILWWLTKT